MKKLIIALFILAIVATLALRVRSGRDSKKLVIGTANPGVIKIYKPEKDSFKEIKNIDSGYKYVWTVRIGDIFNNKKKYLISGVSDSLYGKKYTCKIVGYDLENYEKFEIDEVDSFRCKDLAIGDADNDGDNDIVLVTHGQGIVRLYSWNKDKWVKQDLEKNFIAQIDRQNKTAHRVPNEELPCKECIVQTAVHIAKIGDVDNDGKNEIVTSVSSPLELKNVPELGYVKIFKKSGNNWKSQIVDKYDDIEARGLYIADLYNKGKKALLLGTGTPRNTPASVSAYEFVGNKWDKKKVYSNGIEKNMKAMIVGDLYSDGVQRIVFSTGFPDAKTFISTWKNDKFDTKEIARSSREMKIKDAEYNSMAIVLNKTNDGTQIINGGFITFPKSKKGAEASDRGFLTVYNQKNGKWEPQLIDRASIWAMDLN